jgi:hypothetical protein
MSVEMRSGREIREETERTGRLEDAKLCMDAVEPYVFNTPCTLCMDAVELCVLCILFRVSSCINSAGEAAGGDGVVCFSEGRAVLTRSRICARNMARDIVAGCTEYIHHGCMQDYYT